MLVGAQRQSVGGQLLYYELVIRQVCVQRTDHIVTIGVRPGEVRFLKEDVTLGVGVTSDVEPVPAPAFAVTRAGQQPIHDLGESVGRQVRIESSEFLGRGWQTEKVERDPAQQPASIGTSRRRQAFFFEFRQNEGV